jgi:hypothetical protein
VAVPGLHNKMSSVFLRYRDVLGKAKSCWISTVAL